MVDPQSAALLDKATQWRLRLDHADEADWMAFTDWLEEDPRHNDAYEAVMAQEAAWDPMLAEADFPVAEDEDASIAPVMQETPPMVTTRRRWGAWAASVGAVAVAGLLALQLMPGSDPYAVETGPGEIRTLALADGGQVILNGGTRLILDRKDSRSVELAAGEARFSVVHDAGRPFTVHLGDRELVDVGTVFSVLRDGARLNVGVAEGEVRYDGPGDSVNLKPGDVLSVEGDKAVVSTRPVSAIGSWADGSLVYDGALLGDVAADLSRTTGFAIDIAPGLSGRRFTGVIQTTGTDADLEKRLVSLLGVRVEKQEGSWTLLP